MKKPSRREFLATGAAAGVALSAVRAHAADGDLVIDGELIADAKLYAAAKAEGTLSVYGTYPTESMQPILDGFKKDTGLQLQYLRLPGQNMYPRITAEFSAGKLEADYVDLTDLPLVGELVKLGVLSEPYKVRNFADLPAALKDADGRWYTMIRPVWVIGVNTAVIKLEDAPKSWKELVDPKWAGKIGITSAEAGGSSYVLYAFLRDQVDPGYNTKLAALKPRIFPSVSPVVTNLVRGEVALCVSDAASMVTQNAAGAPVTAIFGSEGIPGFPISGGIAKGAKHPNAAKLWLEWLTSKRGAASIIPTGSYGINPKSAVPTAPGVTFPTQDKVWNVDLDHWVKTKDPYLADWKKAMGVS